MICGIRVSKGEDPRIQSTNQEYIELIPPTDKKQYTECYCRSYPIILLLTEGESWGVFAREGADRNPPPGLDARRSN